MLRLIIVRLDGQLDDFAELTLRHLLQINHLQTSLKYHIGSMCAMMSIQLFNFALIDSPFLFLRGNGKVIRDISLR